MATTRHFSILHILALFVILVMMVFSMAGCKGNDKQKTPADGTNDTAGTIRMDLTAQQLSYLMGNGINLGNTMEAYGRGANDLGLGADPTAYETFWGQPVTTPEIIQGMKDAGFDSLRIPVAWTNAMDFENGDYTIGKDYMDRVEEIVNYALDSGMYVMINDHWDGGWWGMFGSAKQETRDAAMEMYVSMWTQIAERFKNYSDYIIFESGNEEMGDRLNDTDIAEDSGTLSEDECYEWTNKINQAFVDTIRATGGNNAHRFLLIAGYNTDIVKTCDDRFVMPKDTASSKLLISVHYYTPWGYAGTSSLSSWGTVKNYNEQNDLMKMMTKFTDQGYGVVFGEYMVALNKDGSVKNNTTDFLGNFLNNCDLYGYTPMLWDCSYMYKRNKTEIFDEGVANLFKSKSFSAQSNLSEDEVKSAAQEALAAAFVLAEQNDQEAAAREAEALSKSIAWIMFNSGDWSLMYSVGDMYDPGAKSDGLAAVDTEVTGPGTYTVSLDFTGTDAGFAGGTAFSALAISNGETFYPGYTVEIKEVLVNGEAYTIAGKPYTTSDDSVCTRVNLYNGWVTSIPKEARTTNGDTSDVSPVLLVPEELPEIKTLSVTFEYVAPAE